MDPNDKPRMSAGDGDQLPDQGLKVPDVVDFLSDYVGSCHVGIAGDSPECTDLILDHTLRLHLITDDGQRNSSEGSQKTEHYSGFTADCRHGRVNLSEQHRRHVRLDQTGIRDFHV